MELQKALLGVAMALLATASQATEFKSSDVHNSDEYPTVKYYNKTEHSMAPEVLLFSKISWDKLPVQYQVVGRYIFNDTPTWPCYGPLIAALMLVTYVPA